MSNDELLGRPLKPSEITKFKAKVVIPPEVFDIWNRAIADAWDGEKAIVQQVTVNTKLKALTIPYDKIWLDIEDVYGEHGWKVYYDRPAYNEDYEPTFKFTKKRGAR
jgi:hypothetical protein